MAETDRDPRANEPLIVFVRTGSDGQAAIERVRRHFIGCGLPMLRYIAVVEVNPRVAREMLGLAPLVN